MGAAPAELLNFRLFAAFGPTASSSSSSHSLSASFTSSTSAFAQHTNPSEQNASKPANTRLEGSDSALSGNPMNDAISPDDDGARVPLKVVEMVPAGEAAPGGEDLSSSQSLESDVSEGEALKTAMDVANAPTGGRAVEGSSSGSSESSAGMSSVDEAKARAKDFRHKMGLDSHLPHSEEETAL